MCFRESPFAFSSSSATVAQEHLKAAPKREGSQVKEAEERVDEGEQAPEGDESGNRLGSRRAGNWIGRSGKLGASGSRGPSQSRSGNSEQ